MSNKEFWATRSGRWRIKVQRLDGVDVVDGLARIIAEEIHAKQLPAGALLPAPGRVANELDLSRSDVEQAYSTLLEAGVVQASNNTVAVVDNHENGTDIGEATQAHLDEQLLRAAKTARRLGITTADATGVFKNKLRDEYDED